MSERDASGPRSKHAGWIVAAMALLPAAIALAWFATLPPSTDEPEPLAEAEAATAVATTAAAQPAVANTPAATATRVEPTAVAVEAGPFRFPADAGGQKLAATLTPSVEVSALARRAAGPVERKPAVSVEEPPTFLPDVETVPARPAFTQVSRLAPRPLAERFPLEGDRGSPVAPAPVLFAVAPPVRTPAPDPNRFEPLPPLSKQVADRASFDDPTAEFSARFVQTETLPERSAPAPFTPFNLPDPFEHRRLTPLKPAAPDDPATATPVVPFARP